MAETLRYRCARGRASGLDGRDDRGGSHRWTVEADVTAPSKPDLLKHSGRGDFPRCVVRGAMLENGAVQVRLEPIAGDLHRAR